MQLTLSPKQAFKLKLKGETDILDQVEISPGVTIVGKIKYHEETKAWRALAEADGCLVLIEVNLTFPGNE